MFYGQKGILVGLDILTRDGGFGQPDLVYQLPSSFLPTPLHRPTCSGYLNLIKYPYVVSVEHIIHSTAPRPHPHRNCTMFNWHEPACRNPDVVFLDGLNIPYCQSCGETASVDEVVNSKLDRALSKPPSQAKFELCWPSSLPFVEDNDATHIDVESILPVGEPNSSLNTTNQEQSPSSSSAPADAGNHERGPTESLYERLFARKIRILRLLPGAYGDPIRGKLLTKDLAFKPEYEALSYTWADQSGDTSRSQWIFLGKRWDIMTITVNCANALRRLRYPGWSRDVWVDAICINQEDDSERSHQVGLMQNIYANALRVLIYLGEDPCDPDPTPLNPWKFENHGNTLASNIDISLCPYFTRIWVVQEIAVARSAWVLYGSRGMRWEDLSYHFEGGSQELKNTHPWLTHVAGPRLRELEELPYLLSATTKCLASDPRDKVFALLGLCLGTRPAGLTADYSLDQNQIFAGITAFIFVRFSQFRWQILLAAKPSSTRNRPFWAIDWSSTQKVFMGNSITYPGASRKTSKIEHTEENHHQNLTEIQFDRAGKLIMSGAPVFLLDYRTSKGLVIPDAPGLIQDVTFSLEKDYGRRDPSLPSMYSSPKTDRAFSFPAIPERLLILRPVAFPNIYSFVGACHQKQVNPLVGCLDLIDNRVIALFSVWNELLQNIDSKPVWLVPEFWLELKKICDKIKKAWKMTVNQWTKAFMFKAKIILTKRNHENKSSHVTGTPQVFDGKINRPRVEIVNQVNASSEALRALCFKACYRGRLAMPGRVRYSWRTTKGRPVPEGVVLLLFGVFWNMTHKPGQEDDPHQPRPWYNFRGCNLNRLLATPSVKKGVKYIDKAFGFDIAWVLRRMARNGPWLDYNQVTVLLLGQEFSHRRDAIKTLEEIYTVSGKKEDCDSDTRTGIDDILDDLRQGPDFSWIGFSDGSGTISSNSSVPTGSWMIEEGDTLTGRFRKVTSSWAPMLDLVRETEHHLLPLEAAFTADIQMQPFESTPLEEIHIQRCSTGMFQNVATPISLPDSSTQSNGPPTLPTSATELKLCWPSSLTFIEEDTVDSKIPERVEEVSLGLKVEASKDASKDETSHLNSSSSHAPESTPSTSNDRKTLYVTLYAKRIRLLRLLPGRFHDPLRGELKVVNLASKPDYEALSYTWSDLNGDTRKSQSIYIGERCDSLAITSNCANALRRLRSPSWSRDLWVDAICINQDDTRERSHQVGIMQNIYATAARVLVYLGEDPEDLNPAPPSPWKYENNGNTLHLTTDISGQPYFSRVWVIQEVASAQEKHILFGSRGSRWQDLLQPQDGATVGDLRTAGLYAAKRSRERLYQMHPWAHQVFKRRHRDLEELLELLYATVRSEASDPRDKIFALLGLFPEAHNAGLVADYSLSREQVLSGVMAFFLLRHPKERCRLFSTVQPSSASSLPSWVIDWSQKPDWHEQNTPSVPVTISNLRGIGFLGDSSAFRFDRTGGLWLKGASPFRLEDCIFTRDVTQPKPPGIINDILYSPTSEEQRLTAVTWAQETDKIFAVAGLPDHLLILRPVPLTANKYNFVAICGLPSIDNVILINALDSQNILLISAWNYILGDDAWYSPRTWQAMEDICSAIEECWKLEEGGKKTIHSIMELYDRACHGNPSSLGPSFLEALRTMANIPHELSQVLCLEPSGEVPGSGQTHYFWTSVPGFFKRVFGRPNATTRQGYSGVTFEMLLDLSQEGIPRASPLELLRQVVNRRLRLQAMRATQEPQPPRLQETRLPEVEVRWNYPLRDIPRSEKDNILLSETMVQAFWDWGESRGFATKSERPEWPPKPDDHRRNLEWQRGYMHEEHMDKILVDLEQCFGSTLRFTTDVTLDSLLKSLLGQRLDDKLHALSILEMCHCERTKHDPIPTLDSREVMQWLRDSVDLRGEPRNILSSQRPRHTGWGGNFARTWDLLTRDNLHGDKVDEFFSPSSSSGFFWRPVPPATRAKWAPLLDLVKETRARLFPLKESFTAYYHLEERLEKLSVDRNGWEEICIV
ncbi:hypothetical protein CI238_01793 [Colletotrichum incanum]|uniref:Heterokaryon incompatibility domain-containing protein n=1 Tax=Colletotrichum incanum TaxID=1573173 RepID=A0A167BWX8_COLIC|nr:hypothetical protein CI238_01793 [Colletotrichum incanum]